MLRNIVTVWILPIKFHPFHLLAMKTSPLDSTNIPKCLPRRILLLHISLDSYNWYNLSHASSSNSWTHQMMEHLSTESHFQHYLNISSCLIRLVAEYEGGLAHYLFRYCRCFQYEDRFTMEWILHVHILFQNSCWIARIFDLVDRPCWSKENQLWIWCPLLFVKSFHNQQYQAFWQQ